MSIRLTLHCTYLFREVGCANLDGLCDTVRMPGAYGYGGSIDRSDNVTPASAADLRLPEVAEEIRFIRDAVEQFCSALNLFKPTSATEPALNA